MSWIATEMWVKKFLQCEVNEEVVARIELEDEDFSEAVERIQDTKEEREALVRMLRSPSIHWNISRAIDSVEDVTEVMLELGIAEDEIDGILKRFKLMSAIMVQKFKENKEKYDLCEKMSITQYRNEFIRVTNIDGRQVVYADTVPKLVERNGVSERVGMDSLLYTPIDILSRAINEVLSEDSGIKHIIMRVGSRKGFASYIDNGTYNLLRSAIINWKQRGIGFEFDMVDSSPEVESRFNEMLQYLTNYTADERKQEIQDLREGTVCLLGKYIPRKTKRDALSREGNGECVYVRTAIVTKNTGDYISLVTLNGAYFGATGSEIQASKLDTSQLKYEEVDISDPITEVGIDGKFIGTKYVISRFKDDGKDETFVYKFYTGANTTKDFKMPQGAYVYMQLETDVMLDLIRKAGIPFKAEVSIPRLLGEVLESMGVDLKGIQTEEVQDMPKLIQLFDAKIKELNTN